MQVYPTTPYFNNIGSEGGGRRFTSIDLSRLDSGNGRLESLPYTGRAHLEGCFGKAARWPLCALP